MQSAGIIAGADKRVERGSEGGAGSEGGRVEGTGREGRGSREGGRMEALKQEAEHLKNDIRVSLGSQ